MLFSLLPHECFTFCRVCHYPIDLSRADSDTGLCKGCEAKLTKIQNPIYCQKCGEAINSRDTYKKFPPPMQEVA